MIEIDDVVHLTAEAVAATGTTSVLAGIDRVELAEFQRTVDVAGQAFLDRVFTPGELEFAAGRIDRLADRFAAKEAVAKVLGTGFRGLAALEIEIVTTARGRPSAVLAGRAGQRATDIGLRSLAVSMTNTSLYAEAFAVGLCDGLSENVSTPEESEHG
jgi:holo-[acyl-carrier protein] synthase